jgi:hypothetical protein
MPCSTCGAQLVRTGRRWGCPEHGGLVGPRPRPLTLVELAESLSEVRQQVLLLSRRVEELEVLTEPSRASQGF